MLRRVPLPRLLRTARAELAPRLAEPLIAVRELAPGVDVEHAAFAPDGGSVLTCSARQAQLWSADEDGGQLLRVDLHGGRILRSCAFSHDAAWVATGAKDGSIWIWPTDPVRIAEQLR